MKKVLRWIGNLDFLIAALALIAIVCITVAGVVMRKFVNRPIAWLEEMQLFFFVWMVFFGASVAFRTGGQISIDIVAERLGTKQRRILDVFAYLVTMAVLIYLFFGGVGLAEAVTKKVTPYLRISYTLIDIAAPIGCALMVVQYSLLVIREWFFPEDAVAARKGGNAS